MRRVKNLKINLHAIVYNYTYRYWYMWKYRGVTEAAMLKEKRLWNQYQVDARLGQYCRFLVNKDKGPRSGE